MTLVINMKKILLTLLGSKKTTQAPSSGDEKSLQIIGSKDAKFPIHFLSPLWAYSVHIKGKLFSENVVSIKIQSHDYEQKTRLVPITLP